MPNVQVTIQNNIAGQAWDMSEVVTDVTLETFLTGTAGRAKISYLDERGEIVLPEGALVSVVVDSVQMFMGWTVETSESNGNGLTQITAYDQLFYLKNKDTYVFSGLTADQVFAKICQDFQLKYRIVNPSSYVIPTKIHDDLSLSEIIDFGLDQTLINTGKWYFIRDNYGTLEFIDLATQLTNVIIGESSLLSDYNYSRSIKDDTYNQIKLVRENQETQKRDVYLFRDTNTIQAWGILQYYEKVDEEANPAQIESRGDMLLKVKNRPTQKLKLPCIGDTRLVAGKGFQVNVPKLARFGLAAGSSVFITNATHKFANDQHTMTLQVQLDV